MGQEANREIGMTNENGLTRYFNSETHGPWHEVETRNADSQNDTFKLTLSVWGRWGVRVSNVCHVTVHVQQSRDHFVKEFFFFFTNL